MAFRGCSSERNEAFLLPVCSFWGFGNQARQCRKPLLNQCSTVALSLIAHFILLIYIGKDKGNKHTGNARVVIIGKIGQSANEKLEVIVREKTIEQKLVQAVKSVGGIAPKFTSPGFDGMPDRLILLPRGKIAFVEVKRHGEKPRPLQEARHGMLRRLGFAVYVLDDGAQIGEILEQIGGGAG